MPDTSAAPVGPKPQSPRISVPISVEKGIKGRILSTRDQLLFLPFQAAAAIAGPTLAKENPEVAETVAPENTEAAEPDAIDRELEIFQDLQRLQADFVNYRARVERDRGVERQLAVAETLKAFLPVLDDLDRAQAHGDLNDGPMLAIAQKLRAAGEKLGLSVFGEKGEIS